ncbi:MAG: VCBS repeat-containing protein, partial [Candidatus Margulisiibacteriota bacterium]
KSNNFETPIIKQQISIGYFSVISTVDINNDERIDIIIPEHKKLSIYLNNSNGFTHQQIKINATTPIEGVYAIDFTNDYNLDLIVFTLEDVIFL